MKKINKKNTHSPALPAGFSPDFHWDSFKNFYQQCGFTDARVSTLCDVTLKTLQRWNKDNRAPVMAYLAVYLAAGLVLARDWQGFRFVDGKLWSPQDKYEGHSPAQISNYGWHLSVNRELSEEVTRLKDTIKSIETTARSGSAGILPFSAANDSQPGQALAPPVSNLYLHPEVFKG